MSDFIFDSPLPPEKMFVSLLSICETIPMNIKIIFSQHKCSIKSRNNYKENTEKRMKKYREKNSVFLPLFESEYKTLCYWINKEQHTRTYMRVIVNKWLQKKYGNRNLNTVDPCTLCEPVKAIKIFDPSSRGNYVFEAHSLKKHFESALTYSEWMFPKPSHPKNPLTNLDFNEGQCHTIVQSLQKHSYSSWIIEAYKASRWNLGNFALDNGISLKINSITQLCKEPNTETQELLDEFIVNQYEDNDIDDPVVKIVLNWAIKNKLNNAYMKSWINLMKDYYILKFRYNITDDDHTKLNVIYVRSMQLFDKKEIIEDYKNERNLQLESESESEGQVIGHIILHAFDMDIERFLEELDDL